MLPVQQTLGFFWKGTRILEHWALKAPNSRSLLVWALKAPNSRSLLVFGIFLKRDPDFGTLGSESSEFQVPFGFWDFFWKGTFFQKNPKKIPKTKRGLEFGAFRAQCSKIRVPFQKNPTNQKGPGIRSFQSPIFQNPGPFSKKSQKPKGTWNSELSEPNVPKSGSLFKKIPKTKRDLEFQAFSAKYCKIQVPFQSWLRVFFVVVKGVFCSGLRARKREVKDKPLQG